VAVAVVKRRSSPAAAWTSGRRWGFYAAGVLCFLAAWSILYPAQPWEADADIYDSLFAARNLLDGKGLSCDVIYPLTTAFAWGRVLPQPMLQRPPGLALLLVPALLATGQDPALAPRAVRALQIVLLGLIVWLGLRGLRKRGAAAAGFAWLLLLLLNPLLALAVNWGWVEVAGGLLLLLLWLRLRDRDPFTTRTRTALADGVIVALLTLVRTDLVWVPLLWWLAAVLFSPYRRSARRCRGRAAGRHLALAAGAWCVVTLPWWIHVTLVAGSPWFNPLSYALQLDLSQSWWQYPRLRGLDPVPLLVNLRENLVPALLKMRHGIRFFGETLGHWLPWSVWAGGLLLALDRGRRRRRLGPLAAAGPPALLGLTLVGLILVYAFISQEIRHLLVLLPVLAWEIALLAERRARSLRLAWGRRALVLAAGTGLLILVAPPHLAGEAAQLQQARREQARLAALVGRVETWPPGPVFTDNAAVCWLTGRTGVWRPYDHDVEATIRETVPGMREARWARLERLAGE